MTEREREREREIEIEIERETERERIPCGRSVTGVYYYAFMQKHRSEMHKNRPQLLVAGPLIFHDKACLHIADDVSNKLRDYGWEVLFHSPYSPNMSPSDFDLFPTFKKSMHGRSFSSLEELSTDVH